MIPLYLLFGLVLGMVASMAVRHVPPWLEAQLDGRIVGIAPGVSSQDAIIVGLVIVMTWWSLVHFQGDITKACGASILGAALVVLACIDHRTGLLPDMLTLPLLWVGLLLNADALYVSPPQAIWGAAAGYLVPWLFAHGYQAMTGREGLGQGDAKLLAALGAWLGADALLPILFLASVLGIVVFLARIVFLRTAWRAPAPFGPFLALSAIVILLLPETLSRSLLAFGQLQG